MRNVPFINGPLKGELRQLGDRERTFLVMSSERTPSGRFQTRMVEYRLFHQFDGSWFALIGEAKELRITVAEPTIHSIARGVASVIEAGAAMETIRIHAVDEEGRRRITGYCGEEG